MANAGSQPVPVIDEQASEAQQAGSPAPTASPLGPPPESEANRSGESAPAAESGDTARIPPKELGIMLVSAGVIGFVLPGPGVPALVAGGMILWPKGFGKAESWLKRRFPGAHRTGRGQVDRFLNDLERRYPGSTGGPAEPS